MNIKLIAVGDIMPGGVLNGTSQEYVSQEVKNILANGDLRVGTLETAIGNEPTYYVEKMNRKADVIYAEDDDLKRLVELDINIVSLANNHFFDLGPQGAEHTIELLDKLGIKHCGGGRNIQEASMPAVVRIKGKTIAFLAFCDWRDETTGWCPFASDTLPGVNPMYDDYVVKEIKKYRPKFDYLVVIPHWGVEYNYMPSVNVFRTRNKMLAAGADLILGGHTHCVQPIINKNGKSTVFSMGNFLFPDRLICPPRSTYYPHPLLDITKLPITDGYPYVKEITFKIWKPMARIGMIVVTTLDEGGINSKASYTILTKDNVVLLKDLSAGYRKKLNITNGMLLSGMYSQTIFLIKCIRFIRKLPMGIMRKIKTFNKIDYGIKL